VVNLFFKNLIMYIQGSNVNPVQQRMDIGLHEIMSKAKSCDPSLLSEMGGLHKRMREEPGHTSTSLKKELWKCAEMLDWYGTQQTDWLIRELHGHAYRRTTRENKIRDRFTRVLVRGLTLPSICCVCRRPGSPRVVRHIISSLPRVLLPSALATVGAPEGLVNWYKKCRIPPFAFTTLIFFKTPLQPNS
jgi:hypothetical protein